MKLTSKLKNFIDTSKCKKTSKNMKHKKETDSQDSFSDPRNEEDYDTWEYGTEPIPQDHTWRETKDDIQEAL